MMHPLKKARLGLGYSQRMLADFIGISVPTIKRIEAGKAARIDNIRLICDFFTERYQRDVQPYELGLIREEEQETNKQGEQERGEEKGPLPPAPFADGWLLWTLHLGVEAGRLQCRISCPLASGEAWEMVLDPEMNGTDIQSIYRIVQEHVMMQGIKQHANEQEEVASPKVLRFGPLAR
jgi:transcriptional regulator with XRE-family HTH domain